MAVMPQLVQAPPLAYEQPATGGTMTPSLSYQPPAIMSRVERIPGHLLALADGLAGDTNQTQFLDRTMKRATAGENIQQQETNDGVAQMKTFDQFLQDTGGLNDADYQTALHDLQNQMRKNPGAAPVAPAPSLNVPQAIAAVLGSVLDPKNAANNVAGMLGSGIQQQQQEQARMDQQHKLDLSQHDAEVDAAKLAYEAALKKREEAFNTAKEGYSQYAQTYRNDADNKATMDRTKAIIAGQGERQLAGVQAKMAELEAKYQNVGTDVLLKIAASGATPEERQNAADYLRLGRGIMFTPPTTTGGQVELDLKQKKINADIEAEHLKNVRANADLELKKEELKLKTKLSDLQAERLVKEIGWMDRINLQKIASQQATVQSFRDKLALEQDKVTRQDVKVAYTATQQMAKMLNEQQKKLVGQKTGILMALGTASKDGITILEDQLKGVEAQIKGLNNQRSRAYSDLKAFQVVRKPAPSNPAPNRPLPPPVPGDYPGGFDPNKKPRGWVLDPDGVTRFHGN